MDSDDRYSQKNPRGCNLGEFCRYYNVRLCYRLLLLPTVEPFAYVVINYICCYTCCNGNKKGY